MREENNTSLAHHIHSIALCDTHEHLRGEQDYVENGPDILQSLFGNYVTADLIVGGANQSTLDTLLDSGNPDIGARFSEIEDAWQAAQFTGYGEAVRLIAALVYGINELSTDALVEAQNRHAELRQPGERLRLLRDVAKLDHVQIDNFVRPCPVDESGPDFFLYDISWVDFASGNPDFTAIASETGVEVTDLASLRRAMESVFAQHGGNAIAVKTQHAYNRTLEWSVRSDQEAAHALDQYLRASDSMQLSERLCLGDWCLARGVELAIEHDLPIKIHTGYYAGHSRMPVDYIRSGNLCRLLAAYLDARFVLMHIAYPYSDELIALAKHYPNVYADLCWAWSINPYSSADFVRRCIHAVPLNKIFAFGGDTSWPTAVVAYAVQARVWLNRALQAEVDEDYLSEAQAMQVADRFMHQNQYACFNVAAKREHLKQKQSV